MKQNRMGFARWTPFAALAGALVLVVALFSFPPAQAWAQDFLNQFRVKRFTAISIDPARIQQLNTSKVDVQGLIGKDMQVVRDPGAPQATTVDAVRAISSMRVRIPSVLPSDLAIADVRLQGDGLVKMTADVEKLQSLLDAFGITDVKAPAKLNGASITVHTPVNVTMNLRNTKSTVSFVQARSPEVTLPDGVALSDLGLIGLRLIGFSPSDARQFAQTIDWNATLVVPVPANAASFREVTVGSGKALLISSNGTTGGSAPRQGEPTRMENLLLWSDGDMVFGLSGNVTSADLLTIADGLK
ncbi:MAG: hypothetical protein HZB53_17480 [Chloroflexi bacterium]|nr:hypothetical protein [Chloroflexota bacterium]